MSIAAGTLVGLVFLGAIVSLGAVIARTLCPSTVWWWHAGVFFPVGLGLSTYSAFLMSWAGIHLSPWSLLGLLGLILIAVLIANSCSIGRVMPRCTASAPSAIGKWFVLGNALLVCIGIPAGLISVGRSYSTWDAMAAYSVKGYGIALSGTISAADSWGSGGGYPLNVPLGIAMFRLLQGDPEPLSKVIFTLFFVSVCLGILRFWLGQGVPPGHAILAAAILATTPVVFQHGTFGYVNLPFACYLTLGVLHLLEGIGEGNKNEQALGGLLIALSTWTRPDGLPISMLVLAAILGTTVACRWRLPNLQAVFGPLVLIAGPWQVYSWAVAPGGAQAASVDVVAGFVGGVARGEWRLDSFYWIARFGAGQLTDPAVWGLTLPVGLLLLLMRRRVVADRNRPISLALLVVTVIVSLQVVLFYYLLSFSADLLYWLGTDINRMMLPAGLLGWAWVLSLWSHAQTEALPG